MATDLEGGPIYVDKTLNKKSKENDFICFLYKDPKSMQMTIWIFIMSI